MAEATGLGGVFLRTDDPKALYEWYERHLGLIKIKGPYAFPAPTNGGQVVAGQRILSPAQKAMINLQVDDLDGLLDRLQADGLTVDPERQTYVLANLVGG